MKKIKEFYRKKRQQGAIYRSLLCFMLSFGFLLNFLSPISIYAAEREENTTVEESTETQANTEMQQNSENESDTEINQEWETEDVMLIVSHQRQERPEILDMVTRARAFDTGCTLLRVAPAMYTPDVGGKSMAVTPDGRVIADGGGVPGVIRCEIDEHARFTRPASFGEPDKIIDYREALLLSRSHVDGRKY